ncbi:MAG: hypothetical protein H6Q15_2339 [Bacteroidetes bacterium]|nr:hypothetical protein [Bacteroidota bacterium]
MKKIICSVLFILLCCSIYAQEHMKFKGLDITGNVNSFGNLLAKQGYKLQESEDNALTFVGGFASIQNCIIYIIGSPKTSTIWKVAVLLPKENSWSSAKETYRKFKTQLSEKYGIGKSYEFFKDPYFEGDGYEFQAISKDKCYYSTFWTLQSGAVSIEISSSEKIIISYEDGINVLINRKEKAEAVINDL